MQINSIANLTLLQLHRAVAIKEQIAVLETEISEIFGNPRSANRAEITRTTKTGLQARRTRAVTGRKAQGAKRSAPIDLKPARKPRRKMSARARAKLAVSAKARWAKAKAAGKNSLGA